VCCRAFLDQDHLSEINSPPSTMYFRASVLTFSFALFGAVNSFPTAVAEDLCPKNEYACFDVINSSLCLSQQAAPGSGGTNETMAKCVEFDGEASNLSGAGKVSYKDLA
jgi:hypothetical protein